MTAVREHHLEDEEAFRDVMAQRSNRDPIDVLRSLISQMIEIRLALGLSVRGPLTDVLAAIRERNDLIDEARAVLTVVSDVCDGDMVHESGARALLKKLRAR